MDPYASEAVRDWLVQMWRASRRTTDVIDRSTQVMIAAFERINCRDHAVEPPAHNLPVLPKKPAA